MAASKTHTLDRLFATIKSRRDADPSTSYTAQLLADGPARCAKKFGEEAVEVVLAAVAREKKELAAESADVLYHLLVTWAACGVEPADVYATLAAREGRSGLAEKASRKKKAPAKPKPTRRRPRPSA
jgi:phosphoribosyl-ATP pyrophosphohydrolase